MPLTELDKAVGYVAIHQRLVTRPQLQQVLAALEQGPGSAEGLAQALVRFGFIPTGRLPDVMRLASTRLAGGGASSTSFTPMGTSHNQVGSNIRSMQSGKFRLEDFQGNARAIPTPGSNAHAEMRSKYEEYVLRQLLVRQGLMTEGSIRALYQSQPPQGVGAEALGRVILAQNLVGRELLTKLMYGLKGKIFACPNCGNCYFVEPGDRKKRFPCTRCNQAQVEVPSAVPEGGNQGSLAGSQRGYGAPPPRAAPGSGGFSPVQPGAAFGGASGAFGGASGAFGGAAQPGFGGQASGSFGSYGSQASGLQNSGAFGTPTGHFGAQASGSFGAQAGYAPSGSFAPASQGASGFQPSGAFAGSPGMAPFGGAVAPDGFDPAVPLQGAAPGGDVCPERFGDYDIEREIARGGMGVVYLATKRSTGETGALKVMLDSVSQNTKRLKRFQREIEAHQKLVHENIVSILDSGKVDDFYYFTMEFIDGKPLDEMLKTELDLEIVMEILEQICRATDYAHSMGVVHRDLKPANIMVTKKMVPKLTDFGLAKNADNVSVLTKTGAVVGTPYYLSPEQASGQSKDVDHRADVYALGVMMYEMITGRLPFTGKTSVELFRKIINEDPISPVKIKPQLTEEIQTVCMKALEKDPDERYQSAGAFGDDIKALINGKPISARKPGFVRDFNKRLKKKGMAPVFIAGGVLAVLLAGGIAVAQLVTSRWKEEEKQRSLEWSRFETDLKEDLGSVNKKLAAAARLTRLERGRDALFTVNQAIIHLALGELRGGFRENSLKLLEEAGPVFQELTKLISEGRTDNALKAIGSMGVKLTAWPLALRFPSNGEKAAKDRETRSEELRKLRAKLFVARGYAKLALDESTAIERSRSDFNLVVKSIDPEGAIAHVALGDLHLAEGKIAEAIVSYDTGRYNDQNNLDAVIGKVRALRLLEDEKGAREVLTKVLNDKLSDRDKAHVLALRARISTAMGKAEKGLQDIAGASKIAKDDYEVVLARAIVLSRAGKHLEAAVDFTVAIKLAEKLELPEALIARAKILLQRHHYKNALADAEAAVRLNARSLEAVVMRARALELLLEDKRALEDCESVRSRALKRHWKVKSEALMVLARLNFTHENQPSKALAAAREALSIWGHSAKARLLLAHLHLLDERKRPAGLDRAGQLAKEVLKKHPNSAAAKRMLGLVVMRRSSSYESRARAKLAEAYRLDPGDPWTLTALGRLNSKESTKQRYYQRALEAERDVSRREGDYLCRGYAQFPSETGLTAKERAERLAIAAKAFRKALFHDPVHAQAAIALGMIAYTNGDYASARKYLDRGCTNNPYYAAGFLYRGYLRAKTFKQGDASKNEAQIKADLATVERLLIAKDEVPDLYVIRARLIEARKKLDRESFPECLALQDKALALDPDNLTVLEWRTTLLVVPPRDLPKEQWREYRSQHSTVLRRIGDIKQGRLRLVRAVAQLKDALKAGAKGRREEALALVKTAPSAAAGWEAYALACINDGEAAAGIVALVEAAAKDPACGDLYLPILRVAQGAGPELLAQVKERLDSRPAGRTTRFVRRLALGMTQVALFLGGDKDAAARAEKFLGQAVVERARMPLAYALASIVKGGGDRDGALTLLRSAAAMAQDQPYTWVALARLEAKRGDGDAAIRLLQQAKASTIDLGKELAQDGAVFAKLKTAPAWKSAGLP